ncbi:MAG: ATP-binding protein [Chloroflexi bacterium]|nr:ATP-binding protein [Chloroflexota bacterium]
MRNSLIYKVLGAFLLVIAVGSIVISLLTSKATEKAFSLYTTRSGQVWGQRLAPALADFYAQNNNWQGVDAILQSDISAQYAPMGTGNMTGQGHGNGLGQQSGNGMMSSFDQRLILADNHAFVVSDTQNELIGKQLGVSELKNGTSILVNGNLVGTLIITPNNLAQSNSPAGEFLLSVNQAIVSSAVIAGIIALILGAVLFLQITAPLRQLRKAATAITNGDLSQRVSIKSKDEFGELGSTFNKMAESLSNVETQRQHLMADIAHELRTPLAAIQGTLEAMQDGVLPLDGEQLTATLSETTLLNRLIDDLRLLSLAEAGQLKLELQKVNPGELIQQIVDRMVPTANQKNVQLKTEIQTALPEFLLDPDRIAQVLNNLTSNALRYTPEGGMITVQAFLLPNSKSLRVSVTDTGRGIDLENLPFVFDRFYRAEKSRSRSSGGSGLGLAIVKQLVEAHGGQVYAESPVFQDENQKGYGTKISFTLTR